MRREFALAVIAAAFAASHAQADPVSREITLSGEVERFCSINGTMIGSDVTIAGDSATLQNLVDSEGRHQTQYFQLKFPGTVCNAKARARIASANGALVNYDVSDVFGVSRKIHYDVTLSWNGSDVVLNAEGTAVEAVTNYTNGYTNQELVLDFATVQSTQVMQGGTYSDTVTISLELAP